MVGVYKEFVLPSGKTVEKYGAYQLNLINDENHNTNDNGKDHNETKNGYWI